LRADGMKDLCLYWDARVVIEKLWSMSELKKARPKGVNLRYYCSLLKFQHYTLNC
jgi:hypothetical protein